MKLKPILLRSKLGQFISEDEHDFARLCWRQWPKEYSALQTQEVNPEKDVTSICERIARDIRSQYTLTYTPTNIKYDGKYRSIQVKAEAPGKGRLFVRTRAGYYAPLRP